MRFVLCLIWFYSLMIGKIYPLYISWIVNSFWCVEGGNGLNHMLYSIDHVPHHASISHKFFCQSDRDIGSIRWLLKFLSWLTRILEFIIYRSGFRIRVVCFLLITACPLNLCATFFRLDVVYLSFCTSFICNRNERPAKSLINYFMLDTGKDK